MNIVRNLLLTLLVAGVLIACRPVLPDSGMSARAENLAHVENSVPAEIVAAERVDAEHVDAERVDKAAVIQDAAHLDAVAEDAPVADRDPEAGAIVEWADPVLIERGAQVYRENYCGVCHRLAAVDATGVFGPGHDEMGRVAWERIVAPGYDGNATDAAGYIYESIVDPYIYLVESYEVTAHRMPPYAHLDEDALAALVAFLLAQE